VTEIKDVFELRRKVAVQIGEEAKDQEQAGDNNEWNCVTGRAGRGCGVGACSHKRSSSSGCSRKSSNRFANTLSSAAARVQ
jgi:hypothetical protein